MSWQIYCLFIFYILLLITTFIVNWHLGLIFSLFTLFFFAFIAYNANRFLKGGNIVASNVVKRIKETDEDIIQQSPLAVLIYDKYQRVTWSNIEAIRIFNQDGLIGTIVSDLNEQLGKIIQSQEFDWQQLKIGNHVFKVKHQAAHQCIYLFDITESYQITERRKFDKICYGYLLIDDYFEIVQTLDDHELSIIDSELIKDLNEWASNHDVYFKRIEDDKFILLMNQKALEALEAQKFAYLQELSANYNRKNIPVSMSVGISYPIEDDYKLTKLAKEAQVNLELALGRGGDQVVVRSGDNQARFYGGESNPTESRSRTRVKLVYQALASQINQASNVFIAGHKYPDLDSMAAALGIHKIVTEMKKTAKIIVNESTFNQDIKILLESPQINYNLRNIFTDVETAKTLVNQKSLIILVDHHRPSLSEAEELLLNNRNVIIIDHHRRSEEFPYKPVITYIDPAASSTAELVTEFFMNIHSGDLTINRFEATALLAGIIIDTNNFSMRTGTRTFDVASYLKSRGADNQQISRFSKEDLETIKKRNHLIDRTHIYLEKFAITYPELADDIYDNVIASQAADRLLKVKDVEASFVVYPRSHDTVGISARSLGSINVQLIMEKLGGGGHLSNAATQIKNQTIEQVVEQLQNQLVQYLEEKEIE